MTAPTSLWDMSTSPASNTTVQGVNIAEGCAPSGINDAMRAMIAQSVGALRTVTATGTDTITATLVPAPDALTDGLMARVRAAGPNATTTPTFAPNSLPAQRITKLGGQPLVAGDIVGAGHELILVYTATSTRWELLNPGPTALTPSVFPTKSSPTTADSVVIMDAAASNAAKTTTIPQLFAAFNSVAQIVNTETGTVATGTTQFPATSSIPINTQGDQYMSLAITPTNASSTLFIQVVLNISNSASQALTLTGALFQDSAANAIAAVATTTPGSGTSGQLIIFHKMTAGTTSATTFKVRGGANVAGTTTFNGALGGQLYGGVMASSITITEILP